MKKFILVLLSLILITISIIGCSSEVNVDGEAASREEVNVYVEQVFKTLDPHDSTAYVDLYVFNQIYEPLTTIDDDGELQPALAKEWKASDDGLTYTIKLQEGVKFQNGEELKASDVVFSYNRAMKYPTMEIFTNKISKVEAVDDYTVNIHLKNVSASFFSNTAEVPIVNEKFTTEKGEAMREEACGTGPYQLVSYNLNTGAELTRFDDYRLGKAPIKNANLKIITDANTAVVSFESGELDFMMTFNPSAYAPLEASGKYNTKLAPTLHTAYILTNNEEEPLDNILVRQALNYATDKETMIDVAYEGLAVPAHLLAAENSFGVDFSDATIYEYDLDKAKDLLAEAGYPDGVDLGKMQVIGGSYHEKIAQVFQQSLAQIGVKLELQLSETVVTDASAHNYVVSSMGGGYQNDFAYNDRYYVSDALGTGNMSLYKNSRVDELFELADTTLDRSKRAAYYKEVISIVTEEAPHIPIFHKQIPYVWNKNLNAVPHLSSAHPWYIYEWSWN